MSWRFNSFLLSISSESVITAVIQFALTTAINLSRKHWWYLICNTMFHFRFASTYIIWYGLVQICGHHANLWSLSIQKGEEMKKWGSFIYPWIMNGTRSLSLFIIAFFYYLGKMVFCLEPPNLYLGCSWAGSEKEDTPCIGIWRLTFLGGQGLSSFFFYMLSMLISLSYQQALAF